MEMLVWAPVLANPPMATYGEVVRGEYSIDDILQMNLLMSYKGKFMNKEEI